MLRDAPSSLLRSTTECVPGESEIGASGVVPTERPSTLTSAHGETDTTSVPGSFDSATVAEGVGAGAPPWLVRFGSTCFDPDPPCATVAVGVDVGTADAALGASIDSSAPVALDGGFAATLAGAVAIADDAVLASAVSVRGPEALRESTKNATTPPRIVKPASATTGKTIDRRPPGPRLDGAPASAKLATFVTLRPPLVEFDPGGTEPDALPIDGYEGYEPGAEMRPAPVPGCAAP